MQSLLIDEPEFIFEIAHWENVLGNRHIFEHGQFLMNHGDVQHLRMLRVINLYRCPVDHDRSRIRCLLAHNDFNQCALSRSILTQ